MNIGSELNENPGFKERGDQMVNNLRKINSIKQIKEPQNGLRRIKQPKEPKDQDLETGRSRAIRNQKQLQIQNRQLSKYRSRLSSESASESFSELLDRRAMGLADSGNPETQFLKEDRETGTINPKVILRMIEAVGGFPTALTILIMTFAFISTSFISKYLSAKWGVSFRSGEDTTGLVTVVFLMSIATGVVACIRTLIYLLQGTQVSRLIHARMTFQVIRSSITSYLERTPFGQLLNRFSFDIDILDKLVFASIGDVLTLAMYVVINIISIVTGGGNILLVLPCFLFLAIGYWYRVRFMAAKREMTRLYSITKSPISGWTESIVKGSTVLRAMNRQSFCRKKMNFYVEENTKSGIVGSALDYWFLQRLSLWSWTIVNLPCYCYIMYQLAYQEQEVDFGLLFLLIESSSGLAHEYQVFIRLLSELENHMIALERCKAFEEIKAEINYKSLEEDRKLYENPRNHKEFDRADIQKWKNRVIFNKGKIVVSNITAKYPSRAEPVLKDVSVVIQPGTKVGIVGRTGAGKSSFIKLFTRVLIPESGEVLIDGVNIAKIDIRLLRNQIGVLSQKVSLFEESLLENIDPYIQPEIFDLSHNGPKQRVKTWLDEMGMNSTEFDLQGLNMTLKADGANLSQGEKQLISFVRALHKKRKVIIFDEATSNLDQETEKVIQKKIEARFEGCTMLIIAHRLETVMGCDKIMVFDGGRIAEFDSPGRLIDDKESLFSRLCQSM